MMQSYTYRPPELLRYCLRINPEGDTLLEALKDYHKESEEDLLFMKLTKLLTDSKSFYDITILYWEEYQPMFIEDLGHIVSILERNFTYLYQRIQNENRLF